MCGPSKKRELRALESSLDRPYGEEYSWVENELNELLVSSPKLTIRFSKPGNDPRILYIAKSQAIETN